VQNGNMPSAKLTTTYPLWLWPFPQARLCEWGIWRADEALVRVTFAVEEAERRAFEECWPWLTFRHRF